MSDEAYFQIPVPLVRALVAAAKACAEDLEAELKERYVGRDTQPSQNRKFERDMITVKELRAALEAIPVNITEKAPWET